MFIVFGQPDIKRAFHTRIFFVFLIKVLKPSFLKQDKIDLGQYPPRTNLDCKTFRIPTIRFHDCF